MKNLFKKLLDRLNDTLCFRRPTGDGTERADRPDWKGFMREILSLDTWIDSAAVKELFFGEWNRIDYDPRIDADEGPFEICIPGTLGMQRETGTQNNPRSTP